MIEVRTKYPYGLSYIDSIKTVEPIETRYGIKIEQVSQKLLALNGDYINYLLRTRLGLRPVGYEPYSDHKIYAHYPFGWSWLKLIQFFIPVYWWFVSLLYWHTPLFHKIPEGERFSWKYFNPRAMFKHGSPKVG